MGKKKKKTPSNTSDQPWQRRLLMQCPKEFAKQNFTKAETKKTLEKMLFKYACQGETLAQFLLEMKIRQSNWLCFLKKNKWAYKILEDAKAYHYAYGQSELKKMTTGRRFVNQAALKMYMGTFYDITETHKEQKGSIAGSEEGYSIIADVGTKEDRAEFSEGIHRGEGVYEQI